MFFPAECNSEAFQSAAVEIQCCFFWGGEMLFNSGHLKPLTIALWSEINIVDLKKMV